MQNPRLPDFRRLRHRYRGRRKGPALVLGAFLLLVALKLKLPILFSLLLGAVGTLVGYFFGSYVIVAGIALACLSVVALIIGLLYWLYRSLGGTGGSTSASTAAWTLVLALPRPKWDDLRAVRVVELALSKKTARPAKPHAYASSASNFFR